MKLQTTKKQIRQNFNTVLSIGYCDAQYLLDCKNPFAYSAGVYGWSCDYYQIGVGRYVYRRVILRSVTHIDYALLQNLKEKPKLN